MNAKLLACASALALLGCASHGATEHARQELQDRIEVLQSSGHFDEAIDLASKLKDDPDPKIRFGVGYLYFERSQNPDVSAEKRQEDLEVALRMIKRAANENVPQAAGFLADAHAWGRYGLSKDEGLAVCWRSVAMGEAGGMHCGH